MPLVGMSHLFKHISYKIEFKKRQTRERATGASDKATKGGAVACKFFGVRVYALGFVQRGVKGFGKKGGFV